jgi:head-tail adaptor
VLRTRIVIRKRSDVNTRHRLLDGARIYRILGVRVSADHRFLEIDAEEHQD